MEKKLWNNWKIAEKIGEGPNGEVYKGVQEINGTYHYCAIKYISLPKKENDLNKLIKKGIIKSKKEANSYYLNLANKLQEQFNLVKNFQSNYVLKYYDYYQERKKDGIGFDIYLRTDLFSEVIGDITTKKITSYEVVQLGIDICNSIEFLSKNGIIYKNISPNNIFISSDGHYKLGDFIIPYIIETKKEEDYYIAPEIYNNQKNEISYNSDVYSLGLIMYQLLNKNKLPFVNVFCSNKSAKQARMCGIDIPNLKKQNQELMRVILKSCSFLQKDRYNSPNLMKKDLQLILDNKLIANLQTDKYIKNDKTISIYDNKMVENVSSLSKESFLINEKLDKLANEKSILKRFFLKIKNVFSNEDFLNDKIVIPFNNIKEKISNKQFYIDNWKKIVGFLAILFLVLFLRFGVFSTKICKNGYINNLGVCVKGWYTCEKGYTLNKNNKCSKTLKSIDANIKYICEKGYTLKDNMCLKNDTKDAKQAYQCAGLGVLKGDKCIQEQSTKAAVTYTCPSGYIYYEDKCFSASNRNASSNYYCPSGYSLSGSKCSKTEYSNPNSSSGSYNCNSNETLIGNKCYVNASCSTTSGNGYKNPYCYMYPNMPGCDNNPTTTCTCPSGYNKQGTQCYREASYNSGNSYCTKGVLSGNSCIYTSTIDALINYTCPTGYQVYGNQCMKTTSTKPTSKYYCAGGLELRGTECIATITANAINGYECDNGYTLLGNTCVFNDSKEATIEYSCSKVYSLNKNKCEKYKINSPKIHYGDKN